jgi:FkbM family methyltransferase
MPIKSKLYKKLRQYFFPTDFDREILRWFKDNGDETLRLNYPHLNEHSIVFDLGGYKGQFASDIYAKFSSEVFVFEPVAEFYENIKYRFAKNNQIKVFHFGLGKQNEELKIYMDDDGTSIHQKKQQQSQAIKIIAIDEFVQKHQLTKIDLMKINIEGAEYDLLLHIISSKLIDIIDVLQIQFHTFVPNAKILRHIIQEQLRKTHKLNWEYRFVWESWSK